MSVELKIGQVWQEIDSRASIRPKVMIVGLDGERVQLQNSALNGRLTWAKRARFNGKHGGYRLIKDVTA